MLQADHVVYLPAIDEKGNKTLLDVHFVEMTPELINLWEGTAQRDIDSSYSKHPSQG
jgi:hypothetical protein